MSTLKKDFASKLLEVKAIKIGRASCRERV